MNRSRHSRTDELALARSCADALYAADEASRSLGIEIAIERAGSAAARLEVGPAMVNGFGICHGGYVFTLADTAFAFACNAYNRTAFAAAASIEFLRPARLGDRLVAEATERWRGARNGVYDVVVSNHAGETVAIFRGRSHATDRPLVPEEVAESDTRKLE